MHCHAMHGQPELAKWARKHHGLANIYFLQYKKNTRQGGDVMGQLPVTTIKRQKKKELKTSYGVPVH